MKQRILASFLAIAFASSLHAKAENSSNVLNPSGPRLAPGRLLPNLLSPMTMAEKPPIPTPGNPFPPMIMAEKPPIPTPGNPYPPMIMAEKPPIPTPGNPYPPMIMAEKPPIPTPGNPYPPMG